MARIRRNRTIFAAMGRQPDKRVVEAVQEPIAPTRQGRTAARLVPINEVQSGDVLLHGPDDTPDPEHNTVQDVDGFPGMWIIDFTNGTASPPMGNGSVYVARLITANDDERDSDEEKWQSDNDDTKYDPDGDGDIDKGPNANSTDGDGDNEQDDDDKKDAPPWAKESARMKELAAREAMILHAMPLATLAEQQRLMGDLNAIRMEASAIDAAHRSIDLANAVVADHLTPITSAAVRSTGSSDWLSTVETPDFTRTASHTMVVEAGQFYRNLHPAVKADAEELVIQSMGRARQVAGAYRDQEGAVSVFMTEIVRLAEAVPVQEPSEDGAAGSSLPDAVNPSDAPETFDDDTLSATSARRAAPPIRTKANLDALKQAVLDYSFGRRGLKVGDVVGEYTITDVGNQTVQYTDGTWSGSLQLQFVDNSTAGNGAATWAGEQALNAYSSRRTAADWKTVTVTADTLDDAVDQVKAQNDDVGMIGQQRKIGDGKVEVKYLPKTSSRRVASNIDDLRKIVDSKTMGTVAGQQVDMFSASAVVQVFDALSPENQAKFGQIVESNLTQAVDIAFKLANGQRTAASDDDPDDDDGETCSTCGDAIAQDPDGSYHHDNGEKHDHEAQGGGSKESARKTAISLTNVGILPHAGVQGEDTEVGIGTDPSGNRVKFKLSAEDAKSLRSILYSDLSVNFSGVDIEESDIIREGSKRTATEVPVKEPSDDGAAGSTLPDAVNPTDAPETFDDNTLTGDGSGPVTDAGGEGGGSTESAFSKYVRDASKTAAFRQRVEAGRRPFVRSEGAKTAMPNPVDLGVHVGDIFVSSWGYDQTNIDFYEVTGLTGASVKVRPIASKEHGTSTLWAQRDVVPDPGNFKGPEMTKRIQTSEFRGETSVYFTINSYSSASLWDGKPEHETSYA